MPKLTAIMNLNYLWPWDPHISKEIKRQYIGRGARNLIHMGPLLSRELRTIWCYVSSTDTSF